MTIGNRVMFQPGAGGLIGDQGTDLGIVVAEDGGPPAVASVMWQSTGQVTADIPQEQLRLVAAGPLYELARVGCWLQNRTYPPDEGGEKSPAAGGLLLESFALGTYDGELDPTLVFSRITTSNGAGTILAGEDPGPDGLTSTTPPANAVNIFLPARNS